jgi:hypothetical protein
LERAKNAQVISRTPPKRNLATYSIHLRNHLTSTVHFVSAMTSSVLRLNARHLGSNPLIELPTADFSLTSVVKRFLECTRKVAKSINGNME